MNIFCITGPPASGKSTYVKEHKGENDLIFDWDDMFQAVTGNASHTEPTEGQKRTINSLRYSLIRIAKDNSEAIDNLYVISSKPSEDLVEFLGEECKYINLDVTEEEAKQRADSDDSRPNKDSEHQKIDKYFKEGRNMDLLNKIESGRQYRNMVLEVKADEEPVEGSFLVRGYATTYNEPYTLYSDEKQEIREQVDANAFEGCDMEDVIFQYDHQGRVFARKSNNTLSLTSDEHGLLIEADLGGTEIGRQLYEEIKGGYTSKMSFGFTVEDDDVSELETEGKKAIYLRTIKKIGKLYDVSAVSLPANDGTEISARAFCDGVIAKAESERILKVEEERNAKAEELRTRIKKLNLEVRINGN